MITKSFLGRYEYTNYAENSNKFWHIIFNTSTNEYIVHYGRIGKTGTMIIYPENVAQRKIKEKINKGYVKKEGYQEMVGTQSIDFIKNVLGVE